MKKDLDKVIDKIREGLSCLDQDSIFSSISDGYIKIEEACVDYLKLRGYGIRLPYKFPAKIKKLDDLINLFYSLYTKSFSNRIAHVKDEKEERKTASRFIKSRMESNNLDRDTAMQECGEIIKTVFENLDEFNFTVPMTFGIFGQKNMAWVTNTAVEIMNKKIEKYEWIKAEAAADRIIAERSKHHKPGWSEETLNEIYNKIKGEGNG